MLHTHKPHSSKWEVSDNKSVSVCEAVLGRVGVRTNYIGGCTNTSLAVVLIHTNYTVHVIRTSFEIVILHCY